MVKNGKFTKQQITSKVGIDVHSVYRVINEAKNQYRLTFDMLLQPYYEIILVLI